MKKLIGLVAVLVIVGPLVGLVGVAAITNPASSSCGSGSLLVGSIPDTLAARTRDGRSTTLNRTQLTHAATIMTVGARYADLGRPGVLIALMAALTESTLRMLANPSAYPESAGYANDGVGSDHDSLGLFQMRPVSGWGTVAELMSPEYQAQAFFGGPSGPNAGSPRGLLDIAGWQALDPSAVAQAVEVSAYPDRYQNYQPVAESILAALTQAPSATAVGSGLTITETARVVFPLPAGTYTNTDSFGWRIDPYSGARKFHSGSDLAAPMNTPIRAVADGVVSFTGQRGTYGGLITIEHTVGGQRVTSYYAHLYDSGIHVATGDAVAAGQHIGDVGSAGKSTGLHLHLEIHPGGASQPAVNALNWLAEHDASGSAYSGVAAAGCGRAH
ncbi:peptidase M23 [Cryobacterium roopkundense]|uniref:Murein DD-endopeptidase MepM/ murein hydrolase activator NlpD n=1 Tax=Cryobacterium roopkundense TaxID=1001240 RepID=A0A099J366_9MICO|nr:M23 family metallopeptidase [Cryobacterium roopkundense]KGJ71888.1 peptidase M23 [Cryobacterium roopkundense]MBB5640978.1 murein DD-endopeptidase MepM/ murein hydrolase activator NlpD [Cryobacterium roopkundense]